MSLETVCPSCGRSSPITPERIGKKARCRCGHSFTIVARKTGMAPLIVEEKGEIPEAVAAHDALEEDNPLAFLDRKEARKNVNPNDSEGHTARAPATGTRVCEWCAESIPAKALLCPRCTKWRKDIAADRSQCVVLWIGAAICGLGVAFIAYMVCSKDPGEWAEINGWPPGNFGHYEFSLSKFLTSVPGWAVIVGGLGGAFLQYASLCIQRRLRRKTGHGLWT